MRWVLLMTPRAGCGSCVVRPTHPLLPLPTRATQAMGWYRTHTLERRATLLRQLRVYRTRFSRPLGRVPEMAGSAALDDPQARYLFLDRRTGRGRKGGS